jgi:hypothetical protein
VLDLRRVPWRFAAVFFSRVFAALPGRQLLFQCCLALCISCSGLAAAQAQSSGASQADSGQWYVGAYYRHTWVPTFLLKPIFERAAGVSNEGLGLIVSHASRSGITAELGLGYQGYHFEGAFNPNNSIVEDTEWVKSTLGLVHLTGSLLWPVRIQRQWSLEIGLGVDLGIVTGGLHRSEAYPRDGSFRACESAGNPSTAGPDTDADGKPLAYCEQAFDRNGKPTDTSGANVSGAHYNDKETRVPPLMLVPMLPHFALRWDPAERVAIKLEAAFGLVQFWVGASVQVGFGRSRQPAAAEPSAQPEASSGPAPDSGMATEVAPAAGSAHTKGRIIGKLMEESTNKPIAHASVKNRRMFSAIQTDDAGLFVFENLEPGDVRLDLAHPDYEAGGCDASIPAQGGDVNVHCFLRPGSKEGAISGAVKDAEGRPVPAARIEINGPSNVQVQSDSNGLFAILDAPEGTYRLRVQAPGYLVQIIEIVVGPRETALPQIILIRTSEPASR